MKSSTRIVIITSLVLSIMILVKLGQPDPIDWRDSYHHADGIPYGARLIHRVLEQQQDLQPMKDMTVSAAEELRDSSHSSKANYLYVTTRFDPDPESWRHIKQKVQEGATVFIASNRLDTTVRHDLKVSMSYSFPDTIQFDYVNPSIKANSARSLEFTHHMYFDSIPDKATTVLSTVGKEAVFIRIRLGSGQFLLHSVPELFSNYLLTNDTLRPISVAALSFLPAAPTYWDEYYKPDREANREFSLHVLLDDGRLRSAYYVLIASILFFVLFHSGRRQRAIPIIEPLRNATLDFVTTVGMLYYQHRDSVMMIDRKIVYLQEFLRSTFYLSERSIGEQAQEKIASKSGMDILEVRMFFAEIERIHSNRFATDADVIRLNAMIEDFKSRLPGTAAAKKLAESRQEAV